MKLFTYGTLRPSLNQNGMTEGRRSLHTTLTTHLAMVNCGWFPALVASKDRHTIIGELIELSDTDLARFDEYEGCSRDGGGLYHRKQIDVSWFESVPRDGQAWIYVMDADVDQALQNGWGLILSGDWAEAIEHRGLKR